MLVINGVTGALFELPLLDEASVNTLLVSSPTLSVCVAISWVCNIMASLIPLSCAYILWISDLLTLLLSSSVGCPPNFSAAKAR